MSQIKAIVENIENVDNLNIITFKADDIQFTMMSLDITEEMKVGKEVTLGFKPTSLALAKDFSGTVSYSNEFKAIVKSYEIGKLLCSVFVDIDGNSFESIITKKSFDRLELKENDEITVFIKASEVYVVATK
jgi:molybdopterin-binding protein